jgi:hypothetical protein
MTNRWREARFLHPPATKTIVPLSFGRSGVRLTGGLGCALKLHRQQDKVPGLGSGGSTVDAGGSIKASPFLGRASRTALRTEHGCATRARPDRLDPRAGKPGSQGFWAADQNAPSGPGGVRLSGMLFVLRGSGAGGRGIPLAHVGAALRLSVVSTGCKMIDVGVSVHPHDGWTPNFGLRLG